MDIRESLFMLFMLFAFLSINAGKTDDKALYKLRSLCSRALEKRDFQSVRKNAEAYYGKACSDTGSADYGYANFYLGTAKILAGDSRKGLDHIKVARSIGEQTGNDSLTGLALNCMGIYEAKVNYNYYLAQHYLLKSLDYPGIEWSAYVNLAQIARLQRDTTGMRYARMCYQYGVDNDNIYYIYHGLIAMAEFQLQMEQYGIADSTLNRAMEIADRERFGDKSRLRFLHAVILSHQDKPRESNEIMFALHDTILHNIPYYIPELQFVIGKNYELQGDHTLSNEWLEKALDSSERYSSNDYTVLIYKQLSDNYNTLGDKGKALEYMAMAYNMQQKATTSERDRMSKERDLTIEILNRESERAVAMQKVRTHRIVLIFTLIVLLIALCAIWYVVRTLRRRNRLYRRIVSSNVAMIEEKERFMVRLEQLERQQADEPTDEVIPTASNDRQSKSLYLFESLRKLMTDRQLFRNPLLTREEVIEELKTNSTYLTQCIRENANTNYSHYINSFRIQAAVELLSDKTLLSVPIKDIAERAGFNSLTTFYKLFQEAIGISPAAYRKSLKAL